MREYHLLKKCAAITHGSINISGGLKLQKLLYEAIKRSNKHDEVYHDYPVKLIKESVEDDRDEHKVDILTIDGNVVKARNSKGKSFNNTERGVTLLNEYRAYKKSLEAAFPDKIVEYYILKDEYDPTNPLMEKFVHLEKYGIKVYHTENYMIDNYQTDFRALDEIRQEHCVNRCKSKFLKNKMTEEQYNILLEILDNIV